MADELSSSQQGLEAIGSVSSSSENGSNGNGYHSNGNGIILRSIKKRDGREVPYDRSKITSAIARAIASVKENPEADPQVQQIDTQTTAERLTGYVENGLIDRMRRLKERDGHNTYVPGIEDVQNFAERALITDNLPDVAKHFILYRENRTRIRNSRQEVPSEVRDLVKENSKFFPNSMSEFVYYRTYSRFDEEKGRREVWTETVDRYMGFMKKNLEGRLSQDEYSEVRDSILNMKAMPSMRLLWSAGKAAEASNIAAYNCSYTPVTQIRDFSDALYILMCGTGLGFSVEQQAIQQLPIVSRQRGVSLPVHVVGDSKEGWADALDAGLNAWYQGYDLQFDYSKVRPAGEPLKTMGGRSSGPAPLKELLDFSRSIVMKNQRRRLSSLDVHDIMCKEAKIVTVGGVRRSALISLSDLDDVLMRDSKKGKFWDYAPQRTTANNSAVYFERPSETDFLKEWLALIESNSGERGIFNRGGLNRQLPSRRLEWLANNTDLFDLMGLNPCGEINLPPRNFCNVTEVVARSYDTRKTLLEKARVAAIQGTYQSMLTYFPRISSDWKEHCEAERLLGVSITGIMDCPALRDNPELMREMKECVIATNKEYSERFGINPSLCTTCVKPSGTVSRLVNSAAGAHARHNPHYRQNIRISSMDPLFHMLKDQGYPYYPDPTENDTIVLPFAVQSPEGSVYRNDLSAINQLENWKRIKTNYTEHNPSVTISVGPNEWVNTAHWLLNNWDNVGGLSFLPRNDHVYQLAPYEDLTSQGYRELAASLPEIDFSRIMLYEKGDMTSGAKEYACVGGSCSL